MLILHDHGTSLLSALSTLTTARHYLKVQQSKHASTQLEAMTHHLEALTSHCSTLQSQRLAQQTLERCLRDITPAVDVHVVAKQPLHLNHATTSSNRKDRDGQAIVALRAYLDLTLNLSQQNSQGQITKLFKAYTTHVRTAMDTQMRQAEYLTIQERRRDEDGEGERERAGPNESGSRYGYGYGALETRLNELEGELEVVRTRMEGVSSG